MTVPGCLRKSCKVCPMMCYKSYNFIYLELSVFSYILLTLEYIHPITLAVSTLFLKSYIHDGIYRKVDLNMGKLLYLKKTINIYIQSIIVDEFIATPLQRSLFNI